MEENRHANYLPCLMCEHLYSDFTLRLFLSTCLQYVVNSHICVASPASVFSTELSLKLLQTRILQ